jgi:hypothetical protein
MTGLELPVWLAFGALTVVVILNTIVLIGVVRMVVQLYRAVAPAEDPAAPSSRKLAPTFVARALDGSVVDSARFLGRITALLFVSPTCASCMTTLEQLAVVKRRAAGNVVLVCDGDASECRALADTYAPVQVVHDVDRRVRHLYDITRFPMAVLIGIDGKIRSYGEPSPADLQDVVDQPDWASLPPGDAPPRTA